MVDHFSDFAGGRESPATDGFAVTANDAADVPSVTRAVYVGGGGRLSLHVASGADLTFTGPAAAPCRRCGCAASRPRAPRPPLSWASLMRNKPSGRGDGLVAAGRCSRSISSATGPCQAASISPSR